MANKPNEINATIWQTQCVSVSVCLVDARWGNKRSRGARALIRQAKAINRPRCCSHVCICVYIYMRASGWLLYRGLSYSMPLSRCVLIDSATRGRSSGERFLRRERRNVRARGRVFVSEGRRQAVVVGIRTARDLSRPGVRCDVTCV